MFPKKPKGKFASQTKTGEKSRAKKSTNNCWRRSQGRGKSGAKQYQKNTEDIMGKKEGKRCTERVAKSWGGGKGENWERAGTISF